MPNSSTDDLIAYVVNVGKNIQLLIHSEVIFDDKTNVSAGVASQAAELTEDGLGDFRNAFEVVGDGGGDRDPYYIRG